MKQGQWEVKEQLTFAKGAALVCHVLLTGKTLKMKAWLAVLSKVLEGNRVLTLDTRNSKAN